jgi:hypothetical protein
MADSLCASTKRTSHWPAAMSREAPVRFCVSVVVAALLFWTNAIWANYDGARSNGAIKIVIR